MILIRKIIGERTVSSMTLPKFSQAIDRCSMKCSHPVVNAKKHQIFNASPRQSPHTHGYSHSEWREATTKQIGKKEKTNEMDVDAEARCVVDQGKCEVHL